MNLCTYCLSKRVIARGLCTACYQYQMRNGTLKRVQGETMFIDRSGAKCRCGLRLPCNDCLPKTATEFAFARMYSPEAT